MRQEIKSKNLDYSFLRFDKEKSIQIFDDAGWHFNNILSPDEISLKLKTFAHTEFQDEKFSAASVIKKKIEMKIDLFERGHTYESVQINESYPKYLLKNLERYTHWID
jgi:beta-1,4-mannosyl-glycoprotein beta-1,4-N-acetylglucosaminyltransferase